MGDVFLQGGQFRIEFLAQDGQPVAVAVARLLLVRGDLHAQRRSLPFVWHDLQAQWSSLPFVRPVLRAS